MNSKRRDTESSFLDYSMDDFRQDITELGTGVDRRHSVYTIGETPNVAPQANIGGVVCCLLPSRNSYASNLPTLCFLNTATVDGHHTPFIYISLLCSSFKELHVFLYISRWVSHCIMELHVFLYIYRWVSHCIMISFCNVGTLGRDCRTQVY